MKEVTLAIGAVYDQWVSSELHLKYLADALANAANAEWAIHGWHSEASGNPWIRRRIRFPKDLVKSVQGNLHLLDQSYGDALYNYKYPAIATVADIAFWHARGRNPLRWLVRSHIVAGLKKAKALIAISQQTADELVRELGFSEQKIHVVPFAIDDIFFTQAEPISRELSKIIGEKPFLLHVGSLDERKGFFRFLESFRKEPGLPSLVQVGGSPSAELLDYIEQQGLSTSIFFVGKQPKPILHSLYVAAEALVFPSNYEGYGIPPVEARASGTRIITTPMPSVLEALQEAPVLDPKADSDSWLAATRAALALPKPRALTQEQRAQLSWRRAAQDTLRIYRRYF